MTRYRTRPARSPARTLLAAAAAGTAVAAVALAALPAIAATPAASHPAATPAFSGRLYGGTALGPGNAWAVGLGSTGSLVVHWTGKSWQVALHASGFFEASAATSTDDVWAVGGTDWFSPQPLIMHWNGKTWANLTPPALTPGGYLLGITAISAKNAWAVGLIGNGPGDGTSAADQTLALHWNGTAWTQVASPTPAPGGGLGAVSGSSPKDIWAVGWHGAGPDFSGTSRSLTEHWNGTAWTVVDTPSSKSGIRTDLHGVLALSKNDAWAVGGTRLDRVTRTYVLHWNGRQWSRVTSPTQSPGAGLYGVGGSSPSNVWAVGQTSDHGGCQPVKCGVTVERWNGRQWKLVPAPDPKSGGLNILFAVMPTGPANAWAVGTTNYARTLIEHWNGKSWNGPN